MKPKAVCAASCSPSAPSATGVLLQGCRPASPAGEVLSWDCEEEDEEWVLSLELLRVSVLVLVFFIFLLLASGALSTVCRRNPSRLHLLKAWRSRWRRRRMRRRQRRRRTRRRKEKKNKEFCIQLQSVVIDLNTKKIKYILIFSIIVLI